ncbi:MAG: YidC/Oxa1 family membrane protein insertase [Armatimonadota bacterium]
MPYHDGLSPGQHLLAVIALLIVALVQAPAVWCQPAATQEGLPVELVVDRGQDLDEQLTTMRALYHVGEEYLPETGIIAGLKSMFTGGDEAMYATVGTLAEKAAQIRGELVKVEGIYEAGEEERGTLRSMGAEVTVEMMGGSSPQGFSEVGGPDGMPVMITGRVETAGEKALLRAETMVPSAHIAGVRVARLLEESEEWEAAADAYEAVATNGALQSRPLAAFARIRAGQIAFEHLRDEKRARGQFSAAWQPYSVSQNGTPAYYTWVPKEDNGWERMPAAEALAPRLDRLNSDLVGYKIVDVFVRIAGGSPAFGVLLMAVVVRLAIYPLTKKQLESQRRMSALQPQIKELQKKHATDKQKFQEEFWQLCQEHNCNPLGGCLPMLVQMPILIFLYHGIRDYIVQFHGTEFLWIPNLAQPDIWLLVGYTISMVAFQKMAAQSQPAADAQQQQQQQMMAYMMPLMFFFFFRSFPAAFILYWLGSNVIYFSEHLIYRRATGDETEPEAEPEDKASGKKGGLLSSMVEAAKRMQGGGGQGEEERPLSYEQQRKQEKGQKRGKRS